MYFSFFKNQLINNLYFWSEIIIAFLEYSHIIIRLYINCVQKFEKGQHLNRKSKSIFYLKKYTLKIQKLTNDQTK